MYHKRTPNSTCIFLITIALFRYTVADQLDPIEELIGQGNPRTGEDTTDESALKAQEVCNNKVKNAGDISTKFPTPSPNDISFNSSGFRKFGDPCDLSKEREFYRELLEIIKQTAEDVAGIPSEVKSLDLSPQFRFEQYSKHWQEWQKSGDSFRVCNPRWLLECGKSEGEDVCVCLSKGISRLHYTIRLEVEAQVNNGCNDGGKCGGESAEAVTPPYRCVAKTLSTSASDEDEETVSGCELSLPFFGICQIDCNLGSACTVLDPTLLNLKNKKFRNRKVCCDVRRGCLKDVKKSSGPMIKATSPIWHGLLCALLWWLVN